MAFRHALLTARASRSMVGCVRLCRTRRSNAQRSVDRAQRGLYTATLLHKIKPRNRELLDSAGKWLRGGIR